MSSKLFGTKVATSPTLSASIFQMVFHKYTRNHCSTFIATWNRIMFTCVQVCLIKARIEFVYLSILIFSNSVLNNLTFSFLSSSDHLQPSLWCMQYTIELIIAFSASVSWKVWKRAKWWKIILFALVCLTLCL